MFANTKTTNGRMKDGIVVKFASTTTIMLMLQWVVKKHDRNTYLTEAMPIILGHFFQLSHKSCCHQDQFDVVNLP
jgi:hypothetical protein